MKLGFLAFLSARICLLSATSFNCSAQTIKTSKMRVVSPHTSLPDYILFGTYAGECLKYCAIMYKYNLKQKSNKLLIDSTDSYFSKRTTFIVCKSLLVNPSKAELIKKLAANIPKRLTNSARLTNSFGCPDCTDGGGIYVEFGKNAQVRKFYIDYDTDELPSEIRVFAESVKNTVRQINLNN